MRRTDESKSKICGGRRGLRRFCTGHKKLLPPRIQARRQESSGTKPFAGDSIPDGLNLSLIQRHRGVNRRISLTFRMAEPSVFDVRAGDGVPLPKRSKS